ncbi:low molecular weight phosphotyrosine protein phosphatase [Flavobacteriaceae bacterium]|jgi:protein-tyrosine phosphatase|nr:low molecular weight phosphotyrosine protein phosphatase [Flavobacteriaceae bacterium]MDA7808271.1 low molecular weight phosphotyrosine protein phosphatase [Flavobacteriaceae bacterium]MDA9037400.1 low molecular weight phosphotyrosine protein phosphatase [Flavobacteriaceae bacterium]MDA9851355.1 low molecular weight phosphotyrosine protein phosphatase [Flavobacteriaceae bacterium]MDC0872562.1 low molecular weight phosphotyrosine protein phosphatase [Flavobacteriaceae bacterium]
MESTKILMVCLGNICRSPLAQGILNSKITSNTFVDSAGTAAYHVGNPPDPRSTEIAKQKGIDISQYRARKFTKEDFTKFDQIFVMDQSNFEDVIRLAETKAEQDKVSLILPFEQEVPDPYYGGKEGFEYCYSLLDKACDQIIEKMKL